MMTYCSAVEVFTSSGEGQVFNMKTNRCLLIAVTGGIAIAFTGCANQQNATSANTNSSATSYSSNDLQKTGKRTSGDALQAADSSVTASGGH